MSERPMLLTTAALACLAGCSSSRYDQDVAARIDAYRVAAEFSPLFDAPATVAGARVLVRVPRLLREPPPTADQSANGAPPDWSRPAVLPDFPPFEKAFAQNDVPPERHLAILNVAVVPAAERSRDDVEAEVLRQVRGEELFQNASWQKGRDVADVTGTTKKWDVLTLKGSQFFDRAGQDKTPPARESKRSPGTCQIWVSAEPGQDFSVVLAWRVPDDVAKVVQLDTLAPLVARTVQVVPGPPAAAPDQPADAPR